MQKVPHHDPTSVLHLIEECRQKQELYLIEKNREPVQLSIPNWRENASDEHNVDLD